MMANIQDKLNNIKNALFGKDVRNSIHDGIDAINKEVESTTNRQEHLEATFDQLIINSGNSNAEIVDARVGENGKSYAKLGDRLDSVDSQLEHNTNEISNISLKIDGTVNLKSFKCDDGEYIKGDGIHDDTSGIQNAINYLREEAIKKGDINGILTLLIPAGDYKITSTIELSPLVKIKTVGMCVFSSYVEDAPTLKIKNEITDFIDGGLSYCRDWYGGNFIDGSSGFVLNYCGTKGRNSIGLMVGNEEQTNKLHGFMFGTISHLNINKFDVCMQINPINFYCNTFENCNFCISKGGVGVRIGDNNIVAENNAGERITFKNCQFGTIEFYCSMDINFFNCSFDFCNYVFYTPNNRQNMKIYCDSCWFEGMSYIVTDDDVSSGSPYGLIYGDFKYSTFIIENSKFVITNTRKLFNCLSDSAVSYRLILNNIHVVHNFDFNMKYEEIYMCDDRVKVTANNVFPYLGKKGIFVSKNLNLLCEPNFNNVTNGSVDVSSGSKIGNYTVKEYFGLNDAKVYTHETTKALKFTTTASNNGIQLRSEKIPVSLGDTIQANAYYKGFKSLRTTYYYYDKDNNLIGNSGDYVNTIDHSLTEFYYPMYNKIESVPARCAFIEVNFRFATSDGSSGIGSDAIIKELIVQKC